MESSDNATWLCVPLSECASASILHPHHAQDVGMRSSSSGRNARKKLGNTCHGGEAVLWSPCKRKQLVIVIVWEILLGEKEVVKVAEMPKFSKYTREMLTRPLAVAARGNAVVALGCGDSTVISSLLGRHVGWDLLRSRWDELPANTEHLTA